MHPHFANHKLQRHEEFSESLMQLKEQTPEEWTRGLRSKKVSHVKPGTLMRNLFFFLICEKLTNES